MNNQFLNNNFVDKPFRSLSSKSSQNLNRLFNVFSVKTIPFNISNVKNTDAMQRNSRPNDYFSSLNIGFKSGLAYRFHTAEAMGESPNINNLYQEPYNINIYNSKISFNLRYTYPFKYTIFETLLPFLNFSEKVWYPSKTNNLAFSAYQKKDFELDNSIQNSDSFSLFKNQNFKSGENYQALNDHKKDIRILNSSDVSFPNLDYVQYNESFKIYTTLAYTCLKTYEPSLPKYHNFNKRDQKKSQVISFQPFKLLIEDWKSFQKNNESWIFSTKVVTCGYKKFYYQKPSTYPFLITSNLRKEISSFLPSKKKIVATFNQNTIYWHILNLKKFSGYHFKKKPLNFTVLTDRTKFKILHGGVFFSPKNKYLYLIGLSNRYKYLFFDDLTRRKENTNKLKSINRFQTRIGLFGIPPSLWLEETNRPSLTKKNTIRLKPFPLTQYSENKHFKNKLSKISTTSLVNDSYRPKTIELPSIFNNVYKYVRMNNPNFNDAFIITPCTWSLNFQLYRSPNVGGPSSTRVWESKQDRVVCLNFQTKDAIDSGPITNLFYPFIPPQNLFYIDYVFQNTIDSIMFLNSFSKREEMVKNKLHWSKTTHPNNESVWFRSYREKKRLLLTSKNYNNDSYNSKKSCFLVPKFKIKRSLKKLAISFESIYYKNFLWNSRKITLRILNNAVLPLVANRKYSISNFIPKKNYQATRFINTPMPIPISFSPKFSASFVWDSKQKTRPCLSIFNKHAWSYKNFNSIAWKTKNKTTKDWLHQFYVASHFFEIDHYKKLPFYSVRHKTLGTTNFMCEKTYPTFQNENQTQRVFRSNFLASQSPVEVPSTSSNGYTKERQTLSLSSQKNEEYLPYSGSKRFTETLLSSREDKMCEAMGWDPTNECQTQQSGGFFSESFSSLHSKWKPFFTGSLEHSQETNSFFEPSLVHFATQRRKQSKNGENYLLSSNQVPSFRAESPPLGFLASSDRLDQNGRASRFSFNLLNKPESASIEGFYTPEKSISLRKRKWAESLMKGSKSSNLEDIYSKNNFKIKSPLISNLWSSSFFCRYSLYAMSTKSDLFLQNLISSDSWSPNTNEIGIPEETSRTDKKNLEEPFFFKKMQSQYEQSDTNQFLNLKPSISFCDKTIQKILKFQDHKSVNYLVSSYDYHWQKAVHIAILGHFKKPKFNDQRKKITFNWYKNQHNNQFFLQYPKKNIDSISQNSISVVKHKYSVRRLKKYERYFGNPLRRRISENGLSFYMDTKLYEEFSTQTLKKSDQPIIKSWKSIIRTADAHQYFCFRYPLFIQNCNSPWQKSKHVFCIAKHWLNRITVNLKPSSKLTCFSYLSRTVNTMNKELNTSLFMTYTQLSSSSNITHQSLLHNNGFKSITESVYIQIQNKGSYEMVGYFTIKESLNSIYKVNYIVESQVSESGFASRFPPAEAMGKFPKPIPDLAFDFKQSNRVVRPENSMEGPHTIKRFGSIQRDSVTTDSLTVSNFLNENYSFVPSKNMMIFSPFNELMNSQINRSQAKNENEYIQIDIWTNGELSPRQALLNAFRKLFELFYNLSKYNCLKPIEI